MRQSFASRATYWLKVVSLGLVLGTGLQFASAWTAPTAAPPEGNVAGPVTTGSVDQTKNAKLTTLGLDVVKNMNSLRLIAPTPLQYSGIEFYTDIANNPTYTGGIRSHSNRGGRPELELWSGAGANIGNVHITGAGGTSSNLYVDGNVGIGTTTPTKKLDVSGGVKADEFCIGASCINSWPSGGGVADNLGNHTATQNLAMGGFNVSNAANVYANRFLTITMRATTSIRTARASSIRSA